MIWYSYDPGTKFLVLSAHWKDIGAPPILQMTSGPDSNGFTHCFVVCSPCGGPRLPARRLRPPIVWSYGLSDPAEDDHRTRSSSPNDLVFSHLEVLGGN